MTKLGKKFQEAMKDPQLQARLKSAAAAEGAGGEEDEEEEEEPTVLSLASEGECEEESKKRNSGQVAAADAGAGRWVVGGWRGGEQAVWWQRMPVTAILQSHSPFS